MSDLRILLKSFPILAVAIAVAALILYIHNINPILGWTIMVPTIGSTAFAVSKT